jgi:hypothetical protein
MAVPRYKTRESGEAMVCGPLTGRAAEVYGRAVQSLLTDVRDFVARHHAHGSGS